MPKVEVGSALQPLAEEKHYYLCGKDIDSVTHTPEHLRLPQDRVEISHNRVHGAERETDVIHLARHPAGNSDDQVDFLIIV